MSSSEKRLLCEDSDAEEDEDKTKNDEKGSQHFVINSRYATDYEKRKRQEELTNTRRSGDDLYNTSGGSDDDSTSSESEDEDANLLTDKIDLNIFKTINAIKKKEDSIYNPSKQFFLSDDDEYNSDFHGSYQELKHKPKRYRDVVRDQILNKMNEEGDDDNETSDNDDEHNIGRFKDNKYAKIAYDEEQVSLRAAFFDKDHTSDDDAKTNDDDILFLKKEKEPSEISPDQKLLEDEIDSLFASKVITSDEMERNKVDDGEKFLFDFIKNKKWIDKDEFVNSDVLSSKMDDEDAFLEKSDEFESRYNFRFEEAAASAEDSGANEANTIPTSGATFSVVGYARSSLSDTIRRKDESRKMKRLQRKQRKLEERKAKEEQLKRLKNAKKEELEGRISKIKDTLGQLDSIDHQGGFDESLALKLIEGDYDSEKFEDVMSKMYGDQFYEQDDNGWKNDMDVRNDLERTEEAGDEGIILEEGDGALYDNSEVLDCEDENEVDNDEFDTREEVESFLSGDDQESSDAVQSLEKKMKSKMFDELYKLDYEDIIGDMPTRFKYRQVEANDYGLSAEEILFARDTTLKQFVSLRRMAPYDKKGEFNPGYKKRRRFRDNLKAEMLEDGIEKGLNNQNGPKDEAFLSNNVDTEPLTKKKRRRQKKGKKKEKLGGNQGSESNEIPSIETDGTNISIKTRKKKGKKRDKIHCKEANNDAEIEKSTGKDPSTVIESTNSRKRKMKRSQKENSDMKTKVRVSGVSTSRLASYGL